MQRLGRDRDDCSHRAPERHAVADTHIDTVTDTNALPDTNALAVTDANALAVTKLLSESADRERFAQSARLL